jgi:RNA polymerase-binding transcription factor DksA
MLKQTETQTKHQLAAEKMRLEQGLARLHRSIAGESETEPHEEDIVAFERANTAALADVLQRRLHDIKTALEAFENGLYGICERCGEAINPERLAVKPDATFCVPCQQSVKGRRKGR